MRYRVIKTVRLKGRFRGVRFLMAVHSLSVRSLSARELCDASRLKKSEVDELLVELQARGALTSERIVVARLDRMQTAGLRVAGFLRRVMGGA